MLRHHFVLMLYFAKRDFQERYIGTGLGQLWYLLSPVITVFIYTVIFSDFMQMRLNILDNHYAYSIYLIPGLLAWTSFSTTLMRLNNSVLERAHFIKKINIPLYVYQFSIAIAEFVLLLLSYCVGLIFLLIVNHPITMTFLWLLPILLCQSLFAFALGTLVSLFTPFFKDFKEAIPIIIQLWFWMTPIIYMKEMIADKFPALLMYNPMYYFMNIYQDVFLYSKAPHLSTIFILLTISISTLLLALFLYKRMIGTIKDII